MTIAREHVLHQLRTYIRAELLGDVDFPLHDDTPLVAGGLIDSFYFVQLTNFVQDTFGVVISESDIAFEQCDTMAKIADRVIQGAP